MSQQTARRFWPGVDPIGKRLFDMSYRRPDQASTLVWQTVVGVVDDVRYRGLDDVRLDTYVPAAQSNQRVRHLMVRSRSDASRAGRLGSGCCPSPWTARASVTGAVAMADIVAAESAPWRFVVRVFLAFASLAALLAAIGLGTVIALAVSTRRRELAIRAALGADRRRLRAVVMKEGTILVGAGVLTGLACALAARPRRWRRAGRRPAARSDRACRGRDDRIRHRPHQLLVAVASRRGGRSGRGAAGRVTWRTVIPSISDPASRPARRILWPGRRAPAPSRASRPRPAA